MKTRDVEKLYADYVLPTYKHIPLCLVKGKGARVWDLEGREYLDFFPGWAVSGLGHCHPDILNAIRAQSRKILHIPNHCYNLKQAQLAKEISDASFPARVFFCNSGAEATEGAVKFARRYGHPTGRFEIITLRRSFHGRTLAALTATAQEKVQAGYDPLPEGFRYAEMNDPDSVRALVNEKTVAVFLEPIQGEGGIRVASPEFLRGLRALCDEKDMLLMLDEVQTGMGRTGLMFGYQHYGIEPDVMTLAKSLGGGVPIGAVAVHKRIRPDVFSPGSHGSTYGGNPLVAAAALAVFKAIRKGKLLENTRRMGDYLAGRLEALKENFSCIREIRGLGLMRGLELSVPGAAIVERARDRGLLINCTQDTVLRVMPPINVGKKIIDRGMDILAEAFRDSEGRVTP